LIINKKKNYGMLNLDIQIIVFLKIKFGTKSIFDD